MYPNELDVTKDEPLINHEVLTDVAEKLNAEEKSSRERSRRFLNRRNSAELTGRNVRLVSMTVVGSIKTDTNLVDSRTSDLLTGDFSKDKRALENTTDGELKWEKVGGWFNTDMPDKVAELLRSDRVDDAHALLAGRDPDTGKTLDREHYLRANKSALVLYLLGFDRMCMDTRNFRALRPALGALFHNRAVRHPETELANPYRNATPNADASHVPVMTHSGADDWDREKSYWEDKLKWNVPQYDTMTTYVMDMLAEEVNFPRELIPQVAFNTEGDTTFHADLMERL